MITITVGEMQKQFGRYRDAALTEPVSVTHHRRDSIAMLSADEYNRLKTLEQEMDRNLIRRRNAAHKDALEKPAKV